MSKRKFKRKPHRIREKKSLLKKPIFWRMILLTILLAEIFYLVFFFDYFQIKKIIITGNEKITSQNIESLIAGKVKERTGSIFLVNTTKIENAVLNAFPKISDVKIKREFPDSLVAEIKERVPFVYFCTKKEECFFVDETGVDFSQENNISENFLIVRQMAEQENNIILGEQAIKKELIQVIAKIMKNFQENLKITLKEAEITSETTLTFKTDEGWKVFFNPATDVDLQIEKLNLLLEKEIPQESRGKLEYIDLRFEKNRVYYK